MNPLVSVIIPVYNVKPYLREALDSVINQTCKRTEIIIIDDGSTDGSEIISDEYTSDPRVTVIHQKNGGLSNARNAGLDLIKGDYICFLDPDDAFHPGFIEKMLDEVQNAQVEMVVCKYMVQKAKGKLGSNKRATMPIQPPLIQGIYTREDALRCLVKDELDVSVWNKFYKKNLWSNIRFPDGQNYEDMDTMYMLVNSCSKISMIDETLYFKRKRLGSITHNHSVKNIRDWMLSSSHLETFVLSQQPNVFDDALIENYKQRYLNVYMGLYAKCPRDGELRKEIREKIIEKGREVEHWNVRTRVAYFMVCYAPSLFRCAYKIYLPCRLFLWKVTGR